MNRFSVLLPIVLLALSGCSSVRYLSQAGVGQMKLWNRAVPLQDALKDPRLSADERNLIEQVPSIRAFVEAQGLQGTDSYRKFVKLDQPCVVYAVSACAELKFETHTWKFPIAGTVPYLGFFKEQDARDYADRLKRDTAQDVSVRCVPAYSTLGWFDDPLLSSMMESGPEGVGYLAETILHESFHATLYIPDQSPFNEGVADFVGEGLARVYLREQASRLPGALEAYETSVSKGIEYRNALKQLARSLEAVYASSDSDEQKRQKKSALIDQFKQSRSVRREINNAYLAQFLTYTRESEAFDAHFKKCGSDWRRFLSSLSRIRRESFREPQQEQLAPVLESLDCT